MMRQPLWKALAITSFLSFILIIIPQPTVHAGLIDRIKDIYNTPEKISELQQQYIEATEALAQQQQQLEESAKAAAEYALKQKELLEQNNQLIAQNAELQAEMDRMKQDKQSFISKLINTVIIIAAVFVAYIVSLRVWRYVVWRKQRSTGGRGISG
jgi:multidrug efflux pump subunit AcrA (membrane-fusion protein)